MHVFPFVSLGRVNRSKLYIANFVDVLFVPAHQVDWNSGHIPL